MCVGSKNFFTEIGFYELGKNNLAVEMCIKLKTTCLRYILIVNFQVNLYLLIIFCNVTKQNLLNVF